ncbi:MAG TPA: intradiol ring-cleavage dioxygenase [Sphingobium sp.]|nr:intradiol ring-cleavage dioxygenase [Sphingobium sp.]
MQNEATDKITSAVIEKVSSGPNPRVGEISAALVRHMHAFVKEVGLTQEEWESGIEFLTRTGHMCDDKRQEFILLSDALGVSMLVDAINHGEDPRATESTVFGPFYHPTDQAELGADISGAMTGAPLYISGRVLGTDGAPVANAIVDVWHADDQGFYDVQKASLEGHDAGRGWFRTDDQGRFFLWTVRPSAYPIPNDGPVGKMLDAQGRHPFRPAHVHFMIQAEGYRKLVTHLFERGCTYLDSDVVFGVKESLIRDFARHEDGTAPDGRKIDGEWFSLDHDFLLMPLA